MKSEFKKQFQVTLYETEILITTPSNRKDAYEVAIHLPEGKRMHLLDRNGMHFDWIDTKENSFNYYECCGVLILFGITPPEYSELCKTLSIKP